MPKEIVDNKKLLRDFLKSGASGNDNMYDVLTRRPDLTALSPKAVDFGIRDIFSMEGKRYLVCRDDFRMNYQINGLPPIVVVPDFVNSLDLDDGTRYIFKIPVNTVAFHTIDINEARKGEGEGGILMNLEKIFNGLKEANPDTDPNIFDKYRSHWAIDTSGKLVYILPIYLS